MLAELDSLSSLGWQERDLPAALFLIASPVAGFRPLTQHDLGLLFRRVVAVRQGGDEMFERDCHLPRGFRRDSGVLGSGV